MSDYFDSTSYLVTAGTRARASDLNAALAALDTGLALLPTEDHTKRGTINYAVDSGAADAYVVALPYAIVSYSDGMQVVFKASAVNTGACTINVNALGIKSITRQDGTTPIAGDISADKIIELRYNSTSGNFEIQGSIGAASGSGTMATQNANAVNITGGTIGTLAVGTLTPSSTEVNSAAKGMGVTIPRQKVVEIGDWDMDADNAKNVAHGLTLSKIIGARVLIQEDDGSQKYVGSGADMGLGIFISVIGATHVALGRENSGIFDDTGTNATSFNRGWIILDYID